LRAVRVGQCAVKYLLVNRVVANKDAGNGDCADGQRWRAALMAVTSESNASVIWLICKIN
jgi:hypothetical protein